MNNHIIINQKPVNISRRPENNPFLEFGRVKVESPEQFVPLYLAFMSYVNQNNTFDYASKYFSSSLLEDIPIIKNMRKGIDESKAAAATLKLSLKKLFNEPYPEEYGLPITWASVTPIMNTVVESGYNLDTMIEYGMTAANLNRINKVNTGYHILPYFAARISNGNYNALRKAEFPGLQPIMRSNVTVTPEFIGLVKAKHIPYLRVRFALKLPINLPFGDLKFVSVDALNMTNISSYTKSYGTKIFDFINSQQLKIEYCTPDVMRSYIYPKNATFNPVEVAKRALEKTKNMYD